ncbi:hypothetical protein SAMN05444171_5540 [Bradyrhizobium lablabi]|jgi:hypothetical protein|uniref:Uncharacterized protein n=2 Tax=Bradyrhizobium TaxID=374 RepID=A0ABY0PBP6_9BRAD|nr:hypothetical protein SAMN05444163_1630 [Bradyrhizobium ottawaense]SED88837.1 hypothetical protein SAMN05444171_5540 [Bradyrhizobium lablabi]SHL85277.1 hypothetical protein SAMN05444321_4335 [Bradyrhizobium lablabi]
MVRCGRSVRHADPRGRHALEAVVNGKKTLDEPKAAGAQALQRHHVAMT